MNLEALARIMIWGGLIIVVGGILLYVSSKLGISGFKLPGDIYIKKGNFTFYFPIVTCILLSIIITLIFNYFSRR
ncbi:hypothetical protein ASZ90_018489 [hydrocarbon metagenome]|uniref:DUF2905 domain-containing protein n=1 Tax=hydrocarbon metagenome TaxID=938273 RepID=A0A0W8E659_9ZZZZ